MTITLEIPSSQKKELREIASQRGQAPEAFLLSLLDEAILFGDMEPTPDDDAEVRVIRFRHGARQSRQQAQEE